jgi:hypothetical protein
MPRDAEARREYLRVKQWRQDNPERARENARRSKFKTYGLTPEQYGAMLGQQDGRCAICTQAMAEPHIDHDHNTGRVRGLLCAKCNLGLGHFEDDAARMARAITYLTGAQTMDNGRVTGGSVSFMKRVNRGNYEHEEAMAKLDFVAHDGMDASPVLTAAETEAKASVMAQLGLASRPLAQTRSSLEADVAAGKSPKPRHVKSAAILAQEAKEEAAAIVQMNGPDYEDPLAAADASAPATPPVSQVASGASAGGEDPLAPATVSDTTASTASTEEFTAQREVTDADLATAAAKKNEALVKVHKEAGTMKIRDLLGKLQAPGKLLRELPQAERADFLAKLEALT